MEIFVYYLVFALVTGLCLRVASKRHASRRHWEMSPEVVLVISFFLYASAMPVSRLLWGTGVDDADVPFMQAHILAVLGLLIGLIGGKYLSPPKKTPPAIKPLPKQRIVVLTVSALAVILGYIYYSIGFSIANWLQPYSFETTLNPVSTTADTLIEPAAFALLIHCYLSAASFRIARPKMYRFVVAIVGIVAIALLLRGMRNPVQILCLPIFGLAFRNRRVPVFKSGVAAVCVFILFSVVAVVRNFGLINANSAPLTTSSLDPLHGELGTSYNVFRIFNAIGYEDELQYGKTYTVDLGLNLVPRALWPNRPASTAVRFSMRYYGTTDLKFGLGFCPVVEAMANFGMEGIPIVFALFAGIVIAGANYLRGKGRWGLLSYAMLLPMLINWNRIDSNAAFKMFAVYTMFFIVFDKLIYLRLDTAVRTSISSQPLSPARQV